MLYGSDRRGGGTYGQVGLALLVAGVGLSAVSLLLLRSVPLTALGTSALILSLICFGLERSVPRVSAPMGQLLMEAGRLNIAALIEELGLSARAVYLPSAITGGEPRAFIPTSDALEPGAIRGPLPKRLVVPYENGHGGAGVLVATPGSRAVSLVAGRIGPNPGELEQALTWVLVGELDAVEGVAVSLTEGGAVVRCDRIRAQLPPYVCDDVLGSPVAGIIASVVAEGLARPVVIAREEAHDAGLTVALEAR
ncbi:MAG: hypothetical protein HYY02_08035 [Chloroflexi bacterium]|nr:hypothetical protein [Chloroflexota bacterium]